jgi:hypothetical protein
MFGLVSYDKGNVGHTPLGARICDPAQETIARADSFLTIPLYEPVYEQFRGATLPPTSGLESAFVTLGVPPKQKEKARQVFQRSGTHTSWFL